MPDGRVIERTMVITATVPAHTALAAPCDPDRDRDRDPAGPGPTAPPPRRVARGRDAARPDAARRQRHGAAADDAAS